MTEQPRTEKGPEPPEDVPDAASPLRSDALDAELGMLEAMLPAESDEAPDPESSSPPPRDKPGSEPERGPPARDGDEAQDTET